MKARIDRFEVARGAIPPELADGIIYINPQANRAHHLCACGCKSRVLTPLNNWEWSLTGPDSKPSLRPSIGNWNLPCRSHYWIRDGKVIWARLWTPDEIAAGRAREQEPYMKRTWREKITHWLATVRTIIFGEK